jgi:hypothetical protein
MPAVRAPRPSALLFALAIACTAPPHLPVPKVFVPPSPSISRPVSVLVVAQDGRGVADATVCATRPAGAERCAKSGGDGRATLELVAGTYAVRAVPPSGSRLAEGVVTVELGADATVVVPLEGRSTVEGVVRDPEGRPIRNAQVCAHAATSPDVECAQTGTDGAYRIETPPGIHKLEFIGPPDGSRFLTQWARGRIDSFEADLIDSRSHDVKGVDVVLTRGIVLSGTVTAERTGAIVKEAQVCTFTLAAPLGWECERTDRFGRYAALLTPGRYWVWIIPPPERGTRLIPQRYDRVLVGVDATPFVLFEDRRLDVALTEGTLVTGKVTTPDGAPVVLGFVCIDTPFPTGRICRETGDDGSYEIATRPETYVFNVFPPEGDIVGGYCCDAYPDWTVADRFRVGRADARLDMVFPRGVRLFGTVRNARGAPVEGATVNVNDRSGRPRFFASTDIHGRYSVAVLPGTYTVDVFAPRVGEMRSVVGQPMVIDVEAGYDVVLPDATP